MLHRPFLKMSCNPGPEKARVSGTPCFYASETYPHIHYLSIISSAFLPWLWFILLPWPLTFLLFPVFAFPCLESLPKLTLITQKLCAVRRGMDVEEQPQPSDPYGIVCSLPLHLFYGDGLFIKWSCTIGESLVSIAGWFSINIKSAE